MFTPHHVSKVTCHVDSSFFLLLFWDKKEKQVGEGSVNKGKFLVESLPVPLTPKGLAVQASAACPCLIKQT